ncbi:hypothetical protein KFL_002460110 [Klebsormidium nitens]|uniref:Uncharacterized protein n=1 Tax=Klebsormidium nitens TaxID=105231 RepID=A0A1Y1I3X2_KLENI|nr:hypothetical protein KFL_002460110 [Klebsormidium nitens]|eukprot:GAQ85634.1 hypothetical protein KFL_002460110 [Klebsormidium nitens]
MALRTLLLISYFLAFAAGTSKVAAARRIAQSSPMAAANVNVEVTNGVTSQVQNVGNTVTSYGFSTPDSYTCRTDAAMNWGCTLNGVPVLQIPVVLIPVIIKVVSVPTSSPTGSTPSPTPISSETPSPAPTGTSTPVPTPAPSSATPTPFPSPFQSPGLTLPPVSIEGSTQLSVGGVVLLPTGSPAP